MRCLNAEIVWRRAVGGRQRSNAQPMGAYFDRPAEPDAVKQCPCALTLACWPCRPRLPSPEASKGNARETSRLLGLAGRRAVTICRQIEGLLCCPALTSAPEWAGQPCRACTRAWLSPACTPVFFAPCIPGTKRLATSGDVCAIFLPPSHSAFH